MCCLSPEMLIILSCFEGHSIDRDRQFFPDLLLVQPTLARYSRLRQQYSTHQLAHERIGVCPLRVLFLSGYHTRCVWSGDARQNQHSPDRMEARAILCYRYWMEETVPYSSGKSLPMKLFPCRHTPKSSAPTLPVTRPTPDKARAYLAKSPSQEDTPQAYIRSPYIY